MYLSDTKVADTLDAVDEDDEVAVGGKRLDQTAEVFQRFLVAPRRIHDGRDGVVDGRGTRGGGQLGGDGL